MQEPQAKYITREYIDLMYWNFCMGLLSAANATVAPVESSGIVIEDSHYQLVADEFQLIADQRADSMTKHYNIRPSSRIVFFFDNGVFQIKTK